MENLVRKLGSEKLSKFEENFDQLYDEYKKKAIALGLSGELKFSKERGKVIIFAVL